MRFASWWIKCVLGCGEQGRITLLELSAPLSHACKPCTWPKDQPPTKPRAAQAAASNKFAWLLLPRCDDVRGMDAYRGLAKKVGFAAGLGAAFETAAAARGCSDATNAQPCEPIVQ